MQEIIFVSIILGMISIAMLLVILAVAGLSALCGASFTAVFLKGLWVLLIPPAVILYGSLYGRDRISVNTVEISSDRIPVSFDGYRIVHLSDMHLRSFRNRAKVLGRIIEHVDAQKPDLIVFTGDLVTTEPAEVTPFVDSLRSLAAPDGVLSVMGNHDYCPYNDWKTAEERDSAVAEVRAREHEIGWKLLGNSHVDIARTGAEGPDTISVIGVENISAMKQFESRGNLEKAAAGADGSFKVLLSHDPTHWRAGVLGHTDIDLMLSGHTHNAQCRILGLEPSRLVFRENSGLYAENAGCGTQYLYVNDGLGETMFPARIGVPAEITVIVLRSGR